MVNMVLNYGILLLIILLFIWQIVWKGIALWKSALNEQKAWFIVLLILNTAGILEIIYILFFEKHKKHRR